MRERSRTRPIAGAAIAVGVVTLAATAGSVGAKADANAVAKAPIKVITYYDKSIGAGVSPDAPDGVAAALAGINRRGGINGRKVVQIKCDMQNSLTIARACTDKAIKDGVVAALGNVPSGENVTYLPLLQKARIPSIGENPAGGISLTSPAAFPVSATIQTVTAALGVGLAKDGAKKISVAILDFGGSAGTFFDEAEKDVTANGATLVTKVPYPLNPPDMTPYVNAALAKNPDAFFMNGISTNDISFVQTLRNLGSKIPVGLETDNFTALMNGLGPNATGVIVAFDSYPPSLASKLPAVRKMVADFKAAKVSGALENLYAVRNYAVTLAFASVATKLKTVTNSTLWAALNRSTDIRTGLRPTIQFVKGNVDNQGPRIFTNCVFLAKRTAAGGYVPVLKKTYAFIDPATGRLCPVPAATNG